MMLSEEDKLSLLEDITRIASKKQVDIVNPVLYVSGQPELGKRLYNQLALIDESIEYGMMFSDNGWFVTEVKPDRRLHISIGDNIIAPMESGVVNRENDSDFIEQVKQAIQLGKL